MKSRTLLAMVLLAGSAHSAAAAPAPVLTLVGARSGHVDVRFADDTTLDLSEVTARTSGSFAGLAIEERHGDLLAGAVVVPALRPRPVRFQSTEPRSTVELPAGTYRLYLLTDGSSTVTVPVQGRSAARSLRVSRPVSAVGHVLDLGDATMVTRTVPLRVTADTFGLLVMDHYSDVGVAMRAATCFRPDADSDCALGDASTSAVNGVSSFGSTSVAWPGVLTPGSHGVFTVDGAAVGSKTTAFHLTFDPVA